MEKKQHNEAEGKKEKPPKPFLNRGRMFTIALLIGLIMTGGVFAQWSSIWSDAQRSEEKITDLAPTGFSTPSKEYIYAGGKLVAAEEPASSSCSYSISPSFQSFPGNGSAGTGNGTVTVTTATGCNWTAVSNANFINITSGSNGAGSGTVGYSVAANGTGAIRNGTLTVAGQTFTVYQGKSFDDVPVGAPFYNEIGRLVARGVTLGCSTSPPLYCPAQPVTREQMAAFIIRGLGEFNPPTPPTQRFQDVAPSNPFYNFIDRMAVLNITLGCSATPPLYCPASTVTHEQMAAFIIRALGMPNPPTPATQRFQDVPPSNQFYAFIDQMAVRGIWTGCNGNPGLNYCPGSVVTRPEMAAMLVRAFNL